MITTTAPALIAQYNLAFVSEVDGNHTNRVFESLTSVGIGVSCIKKRSGLQSRLWGSGVEVGDVHESKCPPTGLILTNKLLKDCSIDKEILKYITRQFYVPHFCYDVESIFSSQSWKDLLRGCSSNTSSSSSSSSSSGENGIKLKIACSPKSLEQMLGLFIYENHTKDTRISMSKKDFTHCLFCVYDSSSSMFQFGIANSEEVNDMKLMFPTIYSYCLEQRQLSNLDPVCSASKATFDVSQSDREQHDSVSTPSPSIIASSDRVFTPISRAFFKLEEVLSQYIERSWHWRFPSTCACGYRHSKNSRSISSISSSGDSSISCISNNINSKNSTDSSSKSINSSSRCNSNNISLANCSVDAPDLIGVDLGASPGGWTQCLSRRAAGVIAIDPGEINWDLMGDLKDRVTHIHALAESEVTKTAFMNPKLKCENCTLSKVRVIVCDMNIPSSDCATIICRDLLSVIQSNSNSLPPLIDAVIPIPSQIMDANNSNSFYGIIVLTLKLQRHPKQRHISFAFESAKTILLTRGCFDFKIVHAAANSLNERTLVCKYNLLTKC